MDTAKQMIDNCIEHRKRYGTSYGESDDILTTNASISWHEREQELELAVGGGESALIYT